MHNTDRLCCDWSEEFLWYWLFDNHLKTPQSWMCLRNQRGQLEFCVVFIFQDSKRTWWTQITVLGLLPLVRIVTGWPDRKHMSAVLPHWEICFLTKLVRVARCSSHFGGTEVIEEIRSDNWFTPRIRSSHFFCMFSYNAFLPARRQRSIVLRHKNMDARVTSTARRYNQLRFYVGCLWQTTTLFWITSKSHFFSYCYIVWLGVVQPQNIGAIFILSSGSATRLKFYQSYFVVNFHNSCTGSDVIITFKIRCDASNATENEKRCLSSFYIIVSFVSS